MKKSLIAIVVLLANLWSLPVFCQAENEAELLGMPGDNLDLYAVLDLFQKSKTIEDFETTLNNEEEGINNLDLNLDDKVDFIKVQTKQEDVNFTFILQVDVTEKETQDIAVILLSKDKDDKVTLQIVGDKDLYGENYVIEPKPAAPSVTPNPAYTGADPVTVTVPATTVVVVESAPIVHYVYSPVYVPYYPPYYYGYYPPYFAAATVIAVGVYHHNHYHHHHGHYHGGHGNNTVVVHNSNHYNNYNNSRNTSNTVNRNNSNGNYNRNNSNTSSARTSDGSAASRQSTSSADRSTSNANRSSTSNANKPTTSSTNRRTTSNADRSTASSANRSTSSQSTRPSSSSTRQSSPGSYSGGGRSGSYSGGSRGGGGGRGGRR
jgi:uncharacterized membrane protein YgcG